MILEGLVTTANADGRPHLAPMGAVLENESSEPLQRVLLRPYQTSTTFANLKRTGQAVFHVTDDVLLLARVAVGKVDPLPTVRRSQGVEGWILEDACRWHALRVATIDASQPRAEVQTDVVASGRNRDFFGFNRAKHAVLEAAILATRVNLLPFDEIRGQLDRLAVLVEKTAGPREREAFELLEQFVQQSHDGRPGGAAP
jgi:hypothetical protein